MSPSRITDPLLMQLMDAGVLEQSQCTEIVEEHGRTGRSVRHLLESGELVSDDDLLQHTAACMGVSMVDLEGFEPDHDLTRSIPASTAHMYSVVPVEADQTSVTLATSEYVGPEVVDELTFVLNKAVELVVADAAGIKHYIEKHYGDESDSVGDMLSALESELEDAGELPGDVDGLQSIDLEEAASSAPVVRFVNLVIYQAVQSRASDIHFEPFEHDFKIRYRVDGALYEMAPPPQHLSGPVISRIKVVSGLDISERRLPQDGRIQLNVGGKPVDFRVSTLPTQHGESVVLRVLDQSAIGLDLENLGMPQDVFDMFVEDIQIPNGIVAVTGPTGSGKTTTLYSGLRRINKVGTKILTAEEPVEYDIEGIVQVGINEQIGVTFGKVLRAFLRQDPDVILLGEIRDMETAQIAIQASLTGHLVFSTLHTNDAAGAVTRLVDMGVEPFLIASTLQSVMGTRLVRTICSDCKVGYEPDDAVLRSLNLQRSDVGDRQFYYGQGCERCNNTGYRGRRGIYEYLKVTDPIRELINLRSPTLVIRDKAREMGMRTLREDGIRCILDGYATVEEVLKYT